MESTGVIVSFTERDYDRIENCLIKGSLPQSEEWKENDIIIGRPKLFEEVFGIQADRADFIDIYIYDGNEKEKCRLNVVGILDEDKSIKEKFDMLVMPDWNMQSKVSTNTNDTIYVKTNNSEQVDQEILSVLSNVEDKLRIESLKDVIEQNEMFMFSFKVVIYTILTFLAIFSIINLLNTLLTNIIVRKDEFKTMQTVGMTKRQLNKLLIWEGAFIVFKSLVLICIIGTLLGKVVCTLMVNSGFSYMVYKIPVFSIAVCILAGGISILLGIGFIGTKILYGKSK